MPTKAAISLTELDFDSVRASLKTYFEADATFTDYNFEGSGLSILMDILAYNTHYSAFMANMLANEMFLESAQVRKNVISLAKMLGYTPTSRVSSSATLNLVLTVTGTPATVTVPKGTAFTTSVDGVSYNFILRADEVFTAAASYTKDVIVREGVLFTYTHTMNTADTAQKFIIPNAKIDTSTITMKVQTSASDTTTTSHTLQTDYAAVTSTTKNFFLQESDNFFYELYFGDGVIGYQPVDGNLIITEYVACNAGDANGATVFAISGSISGVTDVTITTVSDSAGGGERQSIDKIKLLAPKSYASQGRVVTANDYKTRILEDYPNAAAVKVYGGEEADPPQYGKVFITIKPVTGVTINDTVKAYIKKSLLGPRNVMSIRPEFADPDYLYIVPTVNVKYNPNTTLDSAETIKSQVTTVMENYSNNSIESFDSVFHHSVLSQLISEANTGIVSNILSFSVKKIVTPTLNIVGSYTFDYSNELYHPESGHSAITGGIITSSSFNVLDAAGISRLSYIDEDGADNTRLYYINSGARVYLDNTVGVINYSTGKVTVNNIKPTAVTNTDKTISMNVQLNSPDVVPLRNQIVEIKSSDITVYVTEDVAASSGSTKDYGSTASAGF